MSVFSNKILYFVVVFFATLLAYGLMMQASGSQEALKTQQIGEQYEYSAVPKPTTQPIASSEPYAYFRERAEKEKLYVIILSSLSIVSLVIVLLFVFKTTHTARDIVNASALIVIIFSTILLVILVDTHEQLTGGIGILGAIAGYLFGTMQRRETRREGPEPG